MVAFGGIVHADPTHERASCEMQAKSSFQDLTQEYVSVLENVKVRFEIIANDYQAAFSDKVNSCLLLIHKTASINREISDTSYLIDAASRTMYALYVETNGSVASCLLIPSIKETKPCKGRSEFDDFVWNYLK
ncbi:MAG: hypothetical protein P4L80_05730 [Xanthobacteraceae bacterium]|nr:hypothetical protein [Xanthobacteraceae bacterium]